MDVVGSAVPGGEVRRPRALRWAVLLAAGTLSRALQSRPRPVPHLHKGTVVPAFSTGQGKVGVPCSRGGDL